MEFVSLECESLALCGVSFPLAVAEVEAHVLESGGLVQYVGHGVAFSVDAYDGGAEVHHSSAFSEAASSLLDVVAYALLHAMVAAELWKVEFGVSSWQVE